MPFKGIASHDLPEEARLRAYNKISIAHMSEKNPQWKGDSVGYHALHEWVKGRLSPPDKCQMCHKVPPLDLSNISGEYKRDLTDWHWLCRRCHMLLDGRLGRLHHKARTGWFHRCECCGGQFWVIPSRRLKGGGKYCSRGCYIEGRYKRRKMS